MALPGAFENEKDYFEECLQFLDEYQYLFKFSNVDILTQNVLDNIEVSDGNFDILNDDVDITQINNEFLDRFFTKLKRLQVFYEDFEPDGLEIDLSIPASRKKKHEIICLAKEIKDICEQIECDVVVDLGSGLGYLDQQIFETTKYKVLGIDCNANHHVGAKNRQRKYHESSLGQVKHVKHTISNDSHENIQKFLQNKFGDVQRFCITGLHACADLTIDALDIFLKMDKAKALAIMPCCYHKICIENGRFKNFPLSKCLKDALKQSKGAEYYLGVPFLRLAAHPQTFDEPLKDLVFNLLSRATLELYAQINHGKVVRNRRKPIHTKTLDNDFSKYAECAVKDGFTMIPNSNQNSDNIDFDKEELTHLWNKMAPMARKKAGIYIILQNYLQPIIENFVLYDRLLYLRENDIRNCKFQKILNEKISPRCLVLVAYKNELES